MSDSDGLADIDRQILEVRANLRDLVEQASARSGAQDDDRGTVLIELQEDRLKRLLSEREALERLKNTAPGSL